MSGSRQGGILSAGFFLRAGFPVNGECGRADAGGRMADVGGADVGRRGRKRGRIGMGALWKAFSRKIKKGVISYETTYRKSGGKDVSVSFGRSPLGAEAVLCGKKMKGCPGRGCIYDFRAMNRYLAAKGDEHICCSFHRPLISGGLVGMPLSRNRLWSHFGMDCTMRRASKRGRP